MKQIVQNILKVWESNETPMLITIIKRSGSTPRGLGAQMLVGKNGRITGTIGGGAIEKEAIDLAMERTESFSKDFVLNLNDTSLNMACGGEVKLHFLYMEKILFQETINTINSQIESENPGFMVLDTILNNITFSKEAVNKENVYSLPIPVPDRVIIFGGGHVSQALVPVLSNVGFKCIVVECREELADKTNFPMAYDVICCDYEKVEKYICLKSDDYMVIMTHGHTHDYDCLERLLRKDYAYVGVIGSRRKKAVVNEKLLNAGIPEEKINMVHAPIGLPIGAITPEEIAISITAEIIRVRALRRGQTGEKVCPVT